MAAPALASPSVVGVIGRALCIALALWLAPTASAQASLFAPVSARAATPASDWSARSGAVLTGRQRQILDGVLATPGTVADLQLVTADADLLERASLLRLVLPDGTELTLTTDRRDFRAGGLLSWHGRDGSAPGAAFATLVAHDGMVTGTVRVGGGIYTVRPLTGGLHAVTRADPSDTFDLKDDTVEGPESGVVQTFDAPSGAVGGGVTVTVDVLVAYTADVTAAQATPGAYVQSLIDETNAMLANSNTLLRYNLVHSYETPTMNSGAASTDLGNLIGRSDGRFDEVHDIRDTHEADIVALLAVGVGAGGIARLNAKSETAFSITTANNAQSGIVLAHEMGHNLGARHDPVDDPGTVPYPYAHGKAQDAAGGQDSWRTVMAYANCSAGPCDQLPYFSNPDVTVRGSDAGDAALRDNARLFDERAPLVSTFGRSGPRTLYVDADAASAGDGSSWGTALTSLTDALSIALSGDQIWVADGTYIPGASSTTRNARWASFYMVSGVAVYGGFAGTETALGQRDVVANETVLSGDIDGDGTSAGNAYHVVYANRTASTARLDGFTVTGGLADGVGEDDPFFSVLASRGGGIFVYQGGLTVANSTIVDNMATGEGGGIALSTSTLSLTASTISGNTSGTRGGGIANNSGNATVSLSTISGNVCGNSGGGGGGVFSISGVFEISESSVVNNSTPGVGGGVWNERGTMRVSASTISDNTSSREGGGIANTSGGAASITISASTLSGNTAGGTGGGISHHGTGTLILEGSTVSGNESLGQGGGITVSGSVDASQITSTILWGNTDISLTGVSAQIYNFSPSLSVSYSIVKGGLPGSVVDGGNNRTANPRLNALADNGGPTLTMLPRTGSPAIDAGTCAGQTADQRGRTRPYDAPDGTYPNADAGCDIGAVEAQGVEVLGFMCDGICYVDADAIGGANDGTSWADAALTLQTLLVVADAGAEIWVADGTYYPDEGVGQGDGTRTSTFQLRTGVALYGGFAGGETDRAARDVAANATILSGDLAQDDGTTGAAENAYHVVTASGVDATALLDGFTITAGHADGASPDNSGAGLYIDGGSPSIAASTVIGNVALSSGGGVYIASGTPAITGSLITENSASTGGGVTAGNASTPTITASTITANTATSRGGGVYNNRSTRPVFTGVTVTENATTSGSTGGGFYNISSDALITSSVLWGNSSRGRTDATAQIRNTSSAVRLNPTVSFSVVQSGLSDDTIDGGDNLFVDPLLGPLADNGGPTWTRLPATGSPVIDAGTCAGQTVDQRGETRPDDDPDLANADDGCDIGAVEREVARPVDAQLLTGAAGWRMLATPSTDATVGSFLDPLWTQCFPGADYDGAACATSAPNVFRYDESVPGDDNQGYVAPASATDALPAGAGLFVYAYADGEGALPQTVTASGAEPAAPFTFAVSHTDNGPTAADEGWNLVGNPFRVGLDWDAVTRTGFSEAVYVYDPAADDYRTYSTGAGGDLGGSRPSVVAPFQGAWVQATAASPALVAPAAARSGGGVFQGRTASDPIPTVAFAVTGTVGAAPLADDARVAQVDGSALGVDAADAYELSGFGALSLDVFVVAEGADGPVALDIAAVPPSASEVDLDVRAAGAEGAIDVVLTWPEVTVEGLVMLVDRVTGAEIDLRAATEYRFSVEPGAGADPSDQLRRPTDGDARKSGLRTLSRLDVRRPLRVQVADADGGHSGGARFALRLGTPVAADGAVPTETALGLARPNPTAGGARLTLALVEGGPVRAEVYDALGRRVAVLADGPLAAGRHELRVAAGALAPGTYVVRVVAGGEVLARTLTVVR